MIWHLWPYLWVNLVVLSPLTQSEQTCVTEKKSGVRGHFLGSRPLLFWQLSRQLVAKRINRREEKAVVLIFQMSSNNFGWHTYVAPVRPLRNFFMKEWHVHHTIWTRLSPHNMEVEIWFEEKIFSFFSIHISLKMVQNVCIFWQTRSEASSKSAPLEVWVEFILSPQSGCILSLFASVSFSHPAEMAEDRDESV